MNAEDLFVATCQNDHSYQMVEGESPEEYPCPFCGAPATKEEENV